MARKDYLDLDYHERMEVFTFLRENITPATENLSIRTLIKCFQQKVYSNLIKEPDRWKMIAMLSLLKKNPALVVIDSLLKDKSIVNEEDRIKLFCSKTGMSRPTYYRLRGQLKETGDNSKE